MFGVLTVCTGNICRSPFAERVLDRALRGAAAELGIPYGVVVASAGTDAMEGWGFEQGMADLASAYGADPAGHVARQLDPAMLGSAGLVLALSRPHRRDVVTMFPRANRTAFALPEFARLLADAVDAGFVEWPQAGSLADAMPELVAAAASRRGFTPPPDDPAVDDIVDPYRRDQATHERSAADIADAVARIEAAIVRAARAPRGVPA